MPRKKPARTSRIDSNAIPPLEPMEGLAHDQTQPASPGDAGSDSHAERPRENKHNDIPHKTTARIDSHGSPTSERTSEPGAAIHDDSAQDTGDNLLPEPGGDPWSEHARTRFETRSQACHRWDSEGRRAEVDSFREEVRRECRKAGLSREAAAAAAWDQAMAKFPPQIPQCIEAQTLHGRDGISFSRGKVAKPLELEYKRTMSSNTPSGGDSGRVQGLGDLPPNWPELPANASLPAEIGWVQANRLRIVQEQPTGSTVVRLERALSPAPSHAALGWLETSIRSYAKYVDVVARSLSVVQDEQEHVRRERMAIDEIRELLAEMMEVKEPRA